jgi:hypothetical protein
MANIVSNVPLYPSTALQTITATSGTAATLTLAAPATGLFNYITFLEIVEWFTAANVALTTPTVITSTNITGSPAWSVDGQTGVVGKGNYYVYNYGHPGIKSTANATATTIVAPAVTGIIWRITAGFYVAP